MAEVALSVEEQTDAAQKIGEAAVPIDAREGWNVMILAVPCWMRRVSLLRSRWTRSQSPPPSHQRKPQTPGRLVRPMSDASPPAISISVSHESESPEHDLICRWLRDFNWQANHAFMDLGTSDPNFEQPLLLIVKSDGEVVGGLIAEKRLAWLRISIMAVAPHRRRQGIGRMLVTSAEKWASENACRYLYVDTMQYQSPDFYRSLGFRVVGELPDWDSHGHAKFLLMKQI